MPGRGRTVTRPSNTGTPAAWGDTTNDVYLNARLYWQNVPESVWRYTLGGYQVLKKWLSYREKTVLGRSLSADEVREFQRNVRRIASLLLLATDLDANYHAIKSDTFSPEVS